MLVGPLDRTQLLKGVLDALVLAVLRDADGYGYDVLRRLRRAGLTELGDASVYGTLRRLFGDGLLTSYMVPSDEGPQRKYFGLTDAGRKAIDAHCTSWLSFSSTVTAILHGDNAPAETHR